MFFKQIQFKSATNFRSEREQKRSIKNEKRKREKEVKECSRRKEQNVPVNNLGKTNTFTIFAMKFVHEQLKIKQQELF